MTLEEIDVLAVKIASIYGDADMLVHYGELFRVQSPNSTPVYAWNEDERRRVRPYWHVWRDFLALAAARD